jgi:hypothetical protein
MNKRQLLCAVHAAEEQVSPIWSSYVYVPPALVLRNPILCAQNICVCVCASFDSHVLRCNLFAARHELGFIFRWTSNLDRWRKRLEYYHLVRRHVVKSGTWLPTFSRKLPLLSSRILAKLYGITSQKAVTFIVMNFTTVYFKWRPVVKPPSLLATGVV